MFVQYGLLFRYVKLCNSHKLFLSASHIWISNFRIYVSFNKTVNTEFILDNVISTNDHPV